MKTAAIICEYNPFHNGHRYQIEQIRKQLHADHIIAVMSGDFVQRGTPAFCDKYARAAFALHHGIDLVLELPVCYAGSSAEFFAFGGISLLNALHCVDYLVFGTESASLAPLSVCAKLFTEEPVEYRRLLKQQLKCGGSFPAARAYAASQAAGMDLSGFLTQPNNILGIEYLKALLRCRSEIRPYAIQRTGAGYHDIKLHTIASATGIRREMLTNGVTEELHLTVPDDVFSYFKTSFGKTFPITWDDFKDMLYYQLITEPHPERYLDHHPELMDRIVKNIRNYPDIETLIANVKTKNFTYARISRYLLHLMLKITPTEASAPCTYAKILGIKKSHSQLIRHLHHSSDIPVIQKISQYPAHLEGNARHSFEQTLTATTLYRYAVGKKYGTSQASELSQPLLIV